MVRFGILTAAAVVSFGVLTGSAREASAAKVSLGEAWARCLAYVDEKYPKRPGENERIRESQGIACLRRLGYRP
jgi:hypothetical protein